MSWQQQEDHEHEQWLADRAAQAEYTMWLDELEKQNASDREVRQRAQEQ